MKFYLFVYFGLFYFVFFIQEVPFSLCILTLFICLLSLDFYFLRCYVFIVIIASSTSFYGYLFILLIYLYILLFIYVSIYFICLLEFNFLFSNLQDGAAECKCNCMGKHEDFHI